MAHSKMTSIFPIAVIYTTLSLGMALCASSTKPDVPAEDPRVEKVEGVVRLCIQRPYTPCDDQVRAIEERQGR